MLLVGVYVFVICILLGHTTILGAPPPSKDTQGTSAFVESSLHLTSADWRERVAVGSWLVEFFTPFSPSCKAFAPTWQELTTNKESLRTAYPGAPFSLAQVDCSVERELCVREGVVHVPRLSLYRDGVQTESEFKGDREYTSLSSFVDEEAARYRTSKGVTGTAKPPAEQKQPDQLPPVEGPALPADQPAPPVKPENVQGVAPGPAAKEPQPLADAAKVDAALVQAGAHDVVMDTQQQAAAAVQQEKEKTSAPSTPKPNPDGKVLKFGVDTEVRDTDALHRFIGRDSKQGSVFVKFFAPWCPHCRAMADAFTRVASDLRDQVNVVEVNCEEHRSVCVAFSIKMFPTLRMYNEGEMTVYTGHRSYDAMKGWALKAGSSSGVKQIRASELEEASRESEVFFLHIYEIGTSDVELNAFNKASRALLTTTARAYRSNDGELVQRYKRFLTQSSVGSPLSGILVFKDHDAQQPIAVFVPSDRSNANNFDKELGTWLEAQRYPMMIELSATTFNDVMFNRLNIPVALAALSEVYHGGEQESTGTGSTMRNEELNAFRDLALKWRQREHLTHTSLSGTGEEHEQHILFAWIDADRWATALQKYYGIEPAHAPRLILANGAKMKYHNLPSRTPTARPSVASWLDADEVFQTLDAIWSGNGPKAYSSRTKLELGVYESASFVESMLLWISAHLFTSFLLTLACIGLLVMYLRYQASYMAAHAQRLPTYGKAD